MDNEQQQQPNDNGDIEAKGPGDLVSKSQLDAVTLANDQMGSYLYCFWLCCALFVWWHTTHPRGLMTHSNHCRYECSSPT